MLFFEVGVHANRFPQHTVLMDASIDWLIGQLADASKDWPIDWLIGTITFWSHVGVINGSIDWLSMCNLISNRTRWSSLLTFLPQGDIWAKCPWTMDTRQTGDWSPRWRRRCTRRPIGPVWTPSRRRTLYPPLCPSRPYWRWWYGTKP